VKAHEEIAANILAQLRSRRDEVVARFSDRDRSIADAAVAKAEAELNAPAMLKDLACVFRKSNTHIQMMKSAKKWRGRPTASTASGDGASLLTERCVRSVS
jgi:hypothetical protein